MLILDDLHWADTPSLLLLEFLARDMAEAPVLVLGTYRDVEVHWGDPLARTLGDLLRRSHVSHLPLAGLSVADVARMIAVTSGSGTAGPGPRRETPATRVHEETEGNPLFVQELVRLWAAEGRPAAPPSDQAWRLQVPPTLQEVIGRRLDRLSPECNGALTVAAVLGREFAVDVLGHAGELSGEALLATLDEAEAVRVVVAAAGAPGRYRFTHAVIRETLYAQLSTARRVRLHRQAGAALEAFYGADPEPPLAELAHHFVQAAPGGDVAKAAAYARRAGDRALALFAYEEAIRHYEMALQMQDLGRPADTGERGELLLALGGARYSAGDVAAAREAFLRAAQIGRAIGAPELLARAALGFGVVKTAGVADASTVRLLEEALTALGDADSSLQVRAMSELSRELEFDPSSRHRCDALTREAVAMARRVGDPVALGYALVRRYYLLQAPDQLDERLGAAIEIAQLAQATGERGLAQWAHSQRLNQLLELGDIRGADQAFEAKVRLAEETRLPFSVFTTVYGGLRALLDGQFVEAERLIREARALGPHSQSAALYFASQMVALRRLQGRIGEMEPVIAAMVEQYPATVEWRAGLAAAYCQMDRAADARREFESLAAHDFADLPAFNLMITCVTLAETCAFLGDSVRATRLYEILLPYAGRNVTAGARPASHCVGSVDGYLGLLAGTMVRAASARGPVAPAGWEGAQAHFEAALAFNERMGARPFVAQTQHSYAAMLLARGRSEDRSWAQDLLEQALATARELGMAHLEAQALAAREQLDRTVPPAAQTARYADGLSAREVEVLRPVPAGRPNLLRDVNAATAWAALTAFAWFAFGMVPLQVVATARLGLGPGASASLMCSVWLAGAVATLALSLAYRQPIPITWSTAALIYLVAMAGRFSLAELMGANLIAGILIVLLALLGIGKRLLVWLPVPLVMGMFAGSVLGDMTRMVAVTRADGLVVGTTVAGYLLGRRLQSPRMPPLGLAVIAGALVVVVAHRVTPAPMAWGLPTLAVPAMRFSVPAVIAVSLPLVVLAMGLGNVQGLGFLHAQGYKVPATPVTVVVGLTSVVSALFGGIRPTYPASVLRCWPAPTPGRRPAATGPP